MTHFNGSDVVNTSEVPISQNDTTPINYRNQTLTQNDTTTAIYLNRMNSSIVLADTNLPGLTYFVFGITCFVTVLGLFGNSLILAIISKCRNEPLKAHEVLITALAIFDCIALVPTALSQPRVYDVIGVDIRAITTVGCKCFMGIWQPLEASAITVIVLICIERFVFVWCPLRAWRVISYKLAVKCLLVTLIPVVLVYASTAVLYSEISDGNCIPNFAGKVYSSFLKGKPNTTVYNAAIGFNLVTNMAILFILTPMILVKLYKQRVIRRQLTGTVEDSGQFHTTVKLMAVVVAFIFVALPYGFGIVLRLAGIQVSDSALLSVSTLTLLLHHAINVLLYNTFDAEFRKKALSLMKCGEKPRHQDNMSV